MSLARCVTNGRRSAWVVVIPPGSRRSTLRPVIDTARSRPSGSHPMPDGCPSTRISGLAAVPSGVADHTVVVKKSEYQSRPSRHRGPSPKVSPSRNGFVVVAMAPDSPARAPRGSRPRRCAPVPDRAPAAGGSGATVSRGLLGHEGGPHPDLPRAVAREGRGPGARALARPGRARGEPPVVLRLPLPAARRPEEGHVPRQGRVLRLGQDRVVLPGGGADPDPTRRRHADRARDADGGGGSRPRRPPRDLPRGHPITGSV